MLYFLFFLSGLSGLIYQVVWVREFGNVFGNTVYSASIVVAIFMLGLGSGSFAVGAWADRRYAKAPDSLLRAYGGVELLIAALGFCVSLALPRLGALSAGVSSYAVDEAGWFVLTPMSYVARGAIAFVLLAPIALLMGGTLTLLIRHLVRRDVATASGRTIALLYGVNTAGAAAGAFLTDFVLVPKSGLFATQMIAVALNVAAGVGALWLAKIRKPLQVRLKADPTYTGVGSGFLTDEALAEAVSRNIMGAAITLVLSGFAAMGIEILWLRHFTLLLGGFRAVFSLVLTVMLVGIGAGALAGGAIDRRTSRPAEALILLQALFVMSVLLGLDLASFSPMAGDARAFDAMTPLQRCVAELWYNVRPIVREAGLPSILMGCSFPLANAVIQRAEQTVGRRAGILYFANTAGAVCGSLACGFLLLPWLGMQATATTLASVAAFAVVPLALGPWAEPRRSSKSGGGGRHVRVTLASLGVSTLALALWMSLPGEYVIAHAMAPPKSGERRLTVSEGVTEVIAVEEAPGRGRALITNGHPMSSTALLDQRYMRALAHIPLLAMDQPSRVLVIGFGVGNSTHAAAQHPSVERIEVADLSRHVLRHAGYFRDANANVLEDRRVSVYVNDGRQHLLMQPPAAYDLITLEPPPIAHAGSTSLYSREFYELARTRLKPGGYLSQWLPAYQVTADTTLAMVRAFIDVFPQSVLLSGTYAELLLVGTNAARMDVDPGRLTRALQRMPAVQADLARLDLGSVTEIIGTFVGSAGTLARATRESPAASDDRPLQEYEVRSALGSRVGGVPASLLDLSAVASWCPACLGPSGPTALVTRLGTYLELLEQAYHEPAPRLVRRSAEREGGSPEGEGGRRLLGSAYLGAVVPDTDAVHNILGVALLREGRYADAADAFREALKRRADSVEANRNLGVTLAESGQVDAAIAHLRRAVQLNPGDGRTRYEFGSLLLERRRFAEAASELREALRATPQSAAAHNDLGTALASMGDLHEAIDHFKQAVALDPAFAEGRRNLASALEAQRHAGS